MDFRLTEEQEMLRDGARRFVQENYDFEQRKPIAASGDGFSHAHWATIAELGWSALNVPEDAGGFGFSFVETSLLMEAFGAGLVLEPFATTAVLAARIAERSPDGEARTALLAAIGAGAARVALAHLEQDGRVDPSGPSTVARLEAGRWLLRGTKMLALDGGPANHYIVSARMGEGGGLGLFLVDRTAPGLTVHAYRMIDSTRAADLELRDVALPATALLAGPDADAAGILEEALDRFLLAKVADALGAMEAALGISAEYVKSRVQFGQALFNFQATQHRLAEMFVEVQEVRSILYCGLAHIDAAPAARRRAVSAAVVVAAGSGRVVADLAVQMHGGIGMTDEYRIGHYYKRLLAFWLLYGGTQEQLARLAANDAAAASLNTGGRA
jgi:alkylation response protein AidB-like acyl-CoA dehydrogenase